MGTMTVRMSGADEARLERVKAISGLSASEVMRLALEEYEAELRARTPQTPQDVYAAVIAGTVAEPGDDAIPPAADVSVAVSGIVAAKHCEPDGP